MISNEEFESKILVPCLLGGINSNVCFSVYKAFNNQLVIASDQYLNMFGLNTYNEVPKPILDSFLVEFFKNNLVAQTRNIESETSKAQEVKDFLSICRYHDNELRLLHTVPFFYPDGTFYGFKHNLTDIPHSFNKNFIASQMEIRNVDWLLFDAPFDSKHLHLGKKENYILSMLISGFTQKEIAYKLNCSQPYIAKLIAEKIAPALGLTTNSVKVVISKAISLGFNEFIYRELVTSA